MKPVVRIAAFIGNMAPDFLPIVFTIALCGKKRQNRTIPANAGSRKHAALTFRPNDSTGRKKTSAGFQNCSTSRNKIRILLSRTKNYPLRHFVTPPLTSSFRTIFSQKMVRESAERLNGETTACARHTPLNRGFPSLFAPLGQSSLPFPLMLRISYGQKGHNK